MNIFNGFCSPETFTAAAVFIVIMLGVALYSTFLATQSLRAEYSRAARKAAADPFALTPEQRAREAFKMTGK